MVLTAALEDRKRWRDGWTTATRRDAAWDEGNKGADGDGKAGQGPALLGMEGACRYAGSVTWRMYAKIQSGAKWARVKQASFDSWVFGGGH